MNSRTIPHARSNSATFIGCLPMYLTAESPRPIPIAIRPSERSCSVAYELASTVGSRVAGFVTKWPSLIFDVSRAATASVGIDSCQRVRESDVQAYAKPWLPAPWIRSSQRWYGGSGRAVTPKLRAIESPRRWGTASIPPANQALQRGVARAAG